MMNASHMDDDGLPRSDAADIEPVASRRRNALAFALVFTVLVLGVSAVWLLDDTSQLPDSSPQSCAQIDDSDLRLSCYDRIVHRAVPQPARGATAIVN